MTRVGILGATGYSALALIKILLRHPEVTISVLTSRQEGNPHIASVHPSLRGRLNLECRNLTPLEVATHTECVFCCLPHGVTSEVIPELLAEGKRVIDLSADYRLNDPDVYETWYGAKHNDPERLGKTVYGLPELFGDQIVSADLVANPGCYPTTAILALAPLLKAGLIEPDSIIIDAKSGVSGAGRTPKPATHFPECNESVAAYNVGKHRHTPEIDQILSTASGQEVNVIFTPHLIPMDRGILATSYATPTGDVTEKQLLETLREFYAGKPFVRVTEDLPATKDTHSTNFCDITARVVRGRVMTLSVLDNLVKGAAGAAVQNFNLMYGYEEISALV